MYHTIRTFPRQFLVGYRLGVSPSPLPPPLKRERTGNIFLAGMGGSALPGDLVNDYLGEGAVRIIRNYSLPLRSPSPQPSPVKGEGGLCTSIYVFE